MMYSLMMLVLVLLLVTTFAFAGWLMVRCLEMVRVMVDQSTAQQGQQFVKVAEAVARAVVAVQRPVFDDPPEQPPFADMTPEAIAEMLDRQMREADRAYSSYNDDDSDPTDGDRFIGVGALRPDGAVIGAGEREPFGIAGLKVVRP